MLVCSSLQVVYLHEPDVQDESDTAAQDQPDVQAQHQPGQEHDEEDQVPLASP